MLKQLNRTVKKDALRRRDASKKKGKRRASKAGRRIAKLVVQDSGS